ncbi:MAG: deoxyribonuclease IV [Deferribacterales bacterium]
MLIGSHQSISKSIDLSIQRALADGCECLQIFVKNNNRWIGKELSEAEAEKFRSELALSGLKVCAHSCYLINLASFKDDTYQKSLTCIRDELSRCDRLGVPSYVIHPGSHVGEGEQAGIKRIAESLDRIYDEGYECMTLLEMVAGMGTNIGYSIENMLDIIKYSNHKEKLGICLDSCHIFAAGYDVKDDYDKVFNDLFDAFGDKIKVFHLNDSLKPLGSRRDRHAKIGEGEIGGEFFKKVVNDDRFNDILGILETPVEENYSDEIKLLKSYREK